MVTSCPIWGERAEQSLALLGSVEGGFAGATCETGGL